MAYCNVTTDLTDVYPDIERYQERQIIKNWYTTASAAATYNARNVGQVNMVFDDGEMLTLRTSIATVQAAAGSWWYDAANDLLYVHAKGADNLTTATITIEAGEDWDGFKGDMRNDAMGFMDSILNNRYPTPLQPRLIKTHTTDDYEYLVKHCCALLTCAFIAKRRSPKDPNGDTLYREAWNSNPEIEEQKGLLNQLADGELALQEQITGREVGGFNVYPYASNTATAYVWFNGTYQGSAYQRWRLQIDTAGAEGTATWKLSRDGGTNWDLTLQTTFSTTDNSRRIDITDGIWAIFDGTFAITDYWDIEVIPLSADAHVSKIGSVEVSR